MISDTVFVLFELIVHINKRACDRCVWI